MQDIKPYVINKRRFVKRIYWSRAAVFITVVCFVIIGAVILISYVPAKITLKGREYSFLAVGESDTLEGAKALALGAVQKGGAGYILYNGSYTVVVMCYNSAASASLAAEKVKSTGQNAYPVTVEFKGFKVNKPKSGINNVKTIIKKPYEIFDSLYDISLKLDNGEINKGAALYAARKIGENCLNYARLSENLGISQSGDLGEFFNKAYRIIEYLDESDNVFTDIKYAICSLAALTCGLNSPL